MISPRFHNVAAALAYFAVALAFAWPLPLHIGDALLGPPAGDLGVYVWNLWVFRHEIIAHHAFPFFTSEILALTPPTPMTLQNYTPIAGLLALPLIPWLGTVATFNALTIGSSAVNAYAMFLYARHRTHDAVAAWLGGLVFGFSAYMAARQTVHFSLLLAAPLPIFGLLMYRMARAPSLTLAAQAGLVVAWAFMCDPYYAVYCLMILAFMAGHSICNLDFRPAPLHRAWWISLIDLGLLCMAGLVLGIALGGGGVIEVGGVRVTVKQLYTPVLVATALAILRGGIAIRPRIRWTAPQARMLPVASMAVIVLLIALAPVLYAMASPLGSPLGVGVPVFWRSSAPGVDLLAYLVPNPLHPVLSGIGAAWVAQQPNGFEENVAALPWVALATISGVAVFGGYRLHRGWAVFAALSLGPFLKIAGVLTFVPTPWALIRYLPIVGAARMPTRMAVLVTLGVSMLLAMAVQHLRISHRRGPALVALIGALLLIELLPAPRPLHSATAPQIFRVIAADPRPVRVLQLPFGLRDGLSSRGNTSAEYQFYQTVHEKPLMGGYLSRLLGGAVDRYEQMPVMSALLDLSEDVTLSPARRDAAVAWARAHRSRLKIGWVVVNTSRASAELVDFVREAFDLVYIASDGVWELHRASSADSN